MRFVLGLAEAGFFPGIIYYLTLWYPSRLRATRMAWFTSAVALSGVIGYPVSGLVMEELSNCLGLAGWQWLFLLEGIPPVLAGIAAIFYLDSGIEEARWLTAEEKALLARAVESEEKTKHEHRLIDAFKNGKVYLLSAIYFTLVVGVYGIGFWLPTIVEKSGVASYAEIGAVSAIPYGVCAIGMLILSYNSDRTGERRLHYAFNMTAGAAGLALSGVFSHVPELAIFFLSIGTLGVVGSMPLFWPMPAAFLTGTGAAAGIAIINALGNLGGYAGPNIPVWTAFVWQNPSAPLYIFAGIVLLGAGLTLFVPKSVNVKPGTG
jgi:MFS family permease